jgi:uncharacterized spore protein YtfJ
VVVQGDSVKIINLTQNKDLIGKAIDLVPDVLALLKKKD